MRIIRSRELMLVMKAMRVILAICHHESHSTFLLVLYRVQLASHTDRQILCTARDIETAHITY